jgi:hypothetical protein
MLHKIDVSTNFEILSNKLYVINLIEYIEVKKIKLPLSNQENLLIK